MGDSKVSKMAIRLSGTRLIFVLAAAGVAAGILGAAISSHREATQPPVFDPAQNPYPHGIYANGIIESDQAHASNVNIYPEVSGTVTQVYVSAGQSVKRGDPIARIDDSVQRATVEQLESQARAAKAMLDELKAQPRREVLRVAQAQQVAAEAVARQARDTYDKQRRAYAIDARAVSRDALDTARDAWRVADANRKTAVRNLQLVRAGAWVYDLRNQDATYQSLVKAAAAARALLGKYLLQAPSDGRLLTVNVTPGTYVSSQGVYNPYTQANSDPIAIFATPSQTMDVRCYIDEILIPRLPAATGIKALMFVRGTNRRVPLEFVRIEPYVRPKISLSDARQERVDVRVLPLIFRFRAQDAPQVYPGQLVDVYIGG